MKHHLTSSLFPTFAYPFSVEVLATITMLTLCFRTKLVSTSRRILRPCRLHDATKGINCGRKLSMSSPALRCLHLPVLTSCIFRCLVIFPVSILLHLSSLVSCVCNCTLARDRKIRYHKPFSPPRYLYYEAFLYRLIPHIKSWPRHPVGSLRLRQVSGFCSSPSGRILWSLSHFRYMPPAIVSFLQSVFPSQQQLLVTSYLHGLLVALQACP